MKKLSCLAFALMMCLSGATFAQSKAEPAKAPVAAKADVPKAADAKKEPMDINSASAKELATLPLIGEARSKAIIKGRPYNGKDDLINKKIIPQDAYDGIKDMIVAKQSKKAEKKK